MSFVLEEGPEPRPCTVHGFGGNASLHKYAPPGDAVPVRVLSGQRPSRGWAGPRRPAGTGGPAFFATPPIDQVP
ncbi:hypothetical protein Afil01_50070 [Actinorhabdospora filicis]|uniref:Uncharacterized protein n=1 Tax=Actinorhabdospora filicis TaxID=1785913 RepID=A0A9W6SNM2_9ACTN|nr:hypothetical protein [Actinorhabdospora filicis]GLZ80200.1 hypothetical protein Afil01_50070 [Actinorhabdospora filicis]